MQNSTLCYYQQQNKDAKQQLIERKPASYNFTANNIFIGNKTSSKLISFACNNYLGLANHPKVIQATQQAIAKYGFGARSSCFIVGKHNVYNQLEQQLARHYNQQACLIFSSGYLACLGTISALVGNKDLIIADRLIHASLIDGIKLSQASHKRFLHNNIDHCRSLLQQYRQYFRNCLIVTEAVFSMDGDSPDLPALQQLANEFNCLLLVDHAHSLYNKVYQYQQNCLHIGTLSKALGSIGGYVAGCADLIQYLNNYCRTAIYTTGLPPSAIVAASVALKIKQNLAELALDNASFFCQQLNLPYLDSAIVPMIIGEKSTTLEIATKLKRLGFLVGAIRPPSVEPNKSRLRIVFNATHNKQDIDKLAKAIFNLIKT